MPHFHSHLYSYTLTLLPTSDHLLPPMLGGDTIARTMIASPYTSAWTKFSSSTTPSWRTVSCLLQPPHSHRHPQHPSTRPEGLNWRRNRRPSKFRPGGKEGKRTPIWSWMETGKPKVKGKEGAYQGEEQSGAKFEGSGLGKNWIRAG